MAPLRWVIWRCCVRIITGWWSRRGSSPRRPARGGRSGWLRTGNPRSSHPGRWNAPAPALRRVHEWNKGFMRNPAYARFEVLAAEIDRAVRFMGAAGVDFEAIKTVDFYAGHEALLLDYERALTRIDSRTGEPYNTSAHFVWIGERTRQLDGAHVDLLSRVKNPVGVKLGPTSTAADALGLAERLNPEGIPGRLTFITRMGAGKIRDLLPPLVEGVRDAGIPVVWICDPMHGNTITTENGYKTREFTAILDEVRGFFEVHSSLGTVPGGLHV
ncbi:MAG TPA: 3-deoxy-7-phosphoheptulonate synthase, partial [Actinomycetales bacterium]|nr:3-deoxy-7-phosphoheptulonate synthase [Actinomycetales bacterium]